MDIQKAKKEAYRKRGLDIKEIAKLVRKNLKKEFPKMKFSVRINKYTGGQSLDCDIKEIPLEYIKEGSEFVQEMAKKYNIVDDLYYENDDYSSVIDNYNNLILHLNEKNYYLSKIMIKDDVLERIETIVDFYNYDCSDIITDYFDVGYYSFVGLYHDGTIVTD